jgi:hypothetical protein
MMGNLTALIVWTIFQSLRVLQEINTEGVNTAIQVLQHITSIYESSLNTKIAYRFTLTTQVTLASMSEVFKKLKIINNCLWITMSQERLGGWALLSTEKEMALNLDYNDLIVELAARKLRKADFVYSEWS